MLSKTQSQQCTRRECNHNVSDAVSRLKLTVHFLCVKLNFPHKNAPYKSSVMPFKHIVTILKTHTKKSMKDLLSFLIPITPQTPLCNLQSLCNHSSHGKDNNGTYSVLEEDWGDTCQTAMRNLRSFTQLESYYSNWECENLIRLQANINRV